MSRSNLVIALLTMPFWLGILLLIWSLNPLFVIVPIGIVLFIIIGVIASILYAAEIRTREDWDLVIRSILHRLGFNVAPPASLMNDFDSIDNPDTWQHHHHTEERASGELGQ